MPEVGNFNNFCPLDYRYAVEDLKPYLTEHAFINYKLKVEAALIRTLVKFNLCCPDIAQQILKVIDSITAAEVYAEEKRIKHDIRALVNCIRNKVPEQAKPYVHLFATSYDIVDTANALRYKDAAEKVILPEMLKLENIWIDLALRYKDTLQMGRTHGQHAEPITFGFAVALYIERWGDRILKLKEAITNLKGKFSGAVGAYNAISLCICEPERFEEVLLSELGLKPARISTQILPPEAFTDFFHTVISSFSVLANFADDMRHLQRSEIAEISEEFLSPQVGSSTMPQKRNPINFENIKSMWKAFMPRMITVYLDQISEHQRDLTNSCSQRYLPEILVAFTASIRRMIKVSSRLKVEKTNMLKNFKMSQALIIAEPLYILLAFLGHPNAHEYIRKKTLQALNTKRDLFKIIMEDEEVKPYIDKLSTSQKEIISQPFRYIGIASKKVESVVNFWREKLR